MDSRGHSGNRHWNKLIAALIFEALPVWPLVAVAAAVLTCVIAWLYPAQVRGTGIVRWAPPLLRWGGVVALVLSLLKPVVLQPKSADQWGAVVVLIDCSKSMSVVDTGRTPAERVALAGALGRLPAGARGESIASLESEIERLQSRVREVLGARSDLDYARMSGRGISEKEAHFKQTVAGYEESARAMAARSFSAPPGSELAAALKSLDSVQPPDAREAWVEDVQRKIERVREAARSSQSAADERLYNSNAAVRSACDALAKSTRLELAREALIGTDSGLIAKLGREIPVIGLGINRGLTPIPLAANGRPVAALPLAATANESDLAGAVAAATSGMSNRPLRAIVLLSDGRQVGGRGDVTSSVRPSGVPVFSVGVAADRTPDLSISQVTMPAVSAFAGETLEGVAEVTEEDGIRPPAELHVSTSSGELVERLQPRARAGRRERGRGWSAPFTFQVTPGNGASQQVILSVPAAPGEATLANNRVVRWIKVSSDQLKVATCTGAPGWDFQYLRAALSRRPWVRLQSHVLDPAQPRLAMSPGEILEQDVLILSDVPVGSLDVNQWDAVRALLTTRGGSVIVVAGTSFPIGDYAHQPIARTLLPFHDVRPTWKEWPGEQPAFHFEPTPLGEREALQLGNNPDGSGRRWQELPGVYRYLQLPEKSLYPDVRPLLLEADSHSPVLTERRVGAGRVLFLGLDETWRWRLKAGERDADQFWRQLVRHAAGEPYAVSRGPFALDVDKVAVEPGEAVHVRVRIRGAKSPPPAAASCPLRVLRDGKLAFTRLLQATGAGHFAGQFTDLAEGDYQLELLGTGADGSAQSVRVPLHVAETEEAEMRNVSGDPAMLTRIARSSGGQYLPIDQVDRLPERLNALHETESQFTRRPLWNSPLLFGFVLACFAGEWALRKRLGLA